MTKNAKFDISISKHTITLNFIYAFFIMTALIYVKKNEKILVCGGV